MLKYLIPIALLATPAVAQEYPNTRAIVAMQIAHDRCGLDAPPEYVKGVAIQAISESGMSGNDLADNVEYMASVLGQKYERERTLGQFCARMAIVYSRFQ
jgi:hypothetical protein